MPTQLTIPVRPQFGVGQFETFHAFGGLVGLRFAWETSLGFTFTGLDAAFEQFEGGGGTPIPPPTGAGINLFTNAGLGTLANIGKGLTNTQVAQANHYVQRAWALDGIGTSIERIAQEVRNGRKDTAKKTRPAQIIRIVKPVQRVNLRPINHRVAEAEARAQAAEKENAQLRQRVSALERKVSKPHSVAVPGLAPRIGDLERLGGWLKGEVNRTKKLLGIGAFLILLAKALEKMGLQSMRCSKTKRFTRALCGMNDSWLTSLLQDALLIVSVVSAVEFAKELQAIEAEVVKGLRFGVKELKPGFKPVAGKLH